MTKSFKSERKEAIEYIKSSKDDDFICDLLINNENISTDYKEIILSPEERLDYLHSINEYNYYRKNKIIRSKNKILHICGERYFDERFYTLFRRIYKSTSKKNNILVLT